MFERAQVVGLPEVVAILDEAARWLRGRGIRQWPERFAPDLVRPAVEAGETWLVRVGDRSAATVTVDAADPIWQDRPSAARYVHRMAVRRGYGGLGTRILSWVDELARAAGCEFVRLDCVADNPGLVKYYLERGFVPRGEALVGGAPGQRRTDASHRTVVVRLERLVSAKTST
ncbi:GNAT family N-acetyltransferase [Microlunatus parietis]|uniref:GNAT family N-acetyltransferase n=1 Tax=Microlunatus parietis TaxID=682979 RepID=UPI0015C808D0|nr:GNAT family N-acetyltransferase [Microlunatus parietis]